MILINVMARRVIIGVWKQCFVCFQDKDLKLTTVFDI